MAVGADGWVKAETGLSQIDFKIKARQSVVESDVTYSQVNNTRNSCSAYPFKVCARAHTHTRVSLTSSGIIGENSELLSWEKDFAIVPNVN